MTQNRSSSSVKETEVSTKQLNTLKILLGDKFIDYLSHDYTENSASGIASSYSLFHAYRHLSRRIEDILNKVSTSIEDSVISKSLLSNKLASLEEDSEFGYEVVNMIRYGVGRRFVPNRKEAYIKIPNKYFTKGGYYYLDLHIEEIEEDQSLIVKDNNGNIIRVITDTGEYTVQFSVEHVSNFELYIEVQNTTKEVIIQSLRCHYLTDRFMQYLDYRLSIITDSSEDYITTEQMNAAIHSAINDYQSDIEIAVNDIRTEVVLHILDTNNPHAITPDKIGASKKNHTHDPEDIGAASLGHTHTPSDIGAAAINHTHNPEDIGAATDDHTHTEYIRKDELVSVKHIKPAIILNAPLGKLNHSNPKINLPTINILSKELHHNTSGYVDVSNGIISSSRMTVEGYPIWNGVNGNGTMRFSEGDTFKNTKVNYTFHTKRKIKSIELTVITASNKHPNEVSIYINDVLHMTHVDLTWNNNSTILEYVPSPSNVERLGIEISNIDISNEDWDFNFKVIFDDTDDQEFAISEGITYSYEDADTISISAPTEKIPFDIPDIVKEHTYYIGLDYDPSASKSSVHVAELPPVYGTSDKGIKPFSNIYENKSTDEYYGEVLVTSDTLTGNLLQEDKPYLVYQDSTNSLKTSSGINDINIEHTFGRTLPVKNITIYFYKEEVDNIPRSIQLTADTESGSVEIFSETNYVPDINSDTSYIFLDVLTSKMDMTNFKLKLSDTDLDTIKINQIEITLDTEHYDIHRCKWDSGVSRKYIGTIYKNNNDNYDIQSYPLGDVCYLPINGLNLTDNNGRYEIVNPFNTTILDYEIVDVTLSSDSVVFEPRAGVVKVTEDKIIINTMTSGRFALYISRNW